jgi:alpha-maltose-1-phosphate synthase
MKILFPIHIDRWRSPISSQLREYALYNDDIDFYSFSSPETNEDVEKGTLFWSRPNIHKIDKKSLLSIKFDLAHTASATTANIMATLAAKVGNRFRCRHIYTVSSEPLKDDPFYWHYLVSLKIADKVYCVSQSAQRAIIKYGCPGNGVINNGFDPMFFDPALANRQVLNKYDLKVPFYLFCGVLEKRKRPDIFIKLAQQMPQAQFVMTGGYHSLDGAAPYLKQLEKIRNIHNLGRITRTELRDLMACATALIFPSESEGLPLSVIEASGMGLPVLGQPASSMPEIVNEGKNGWLLPINNLEQWIDKLNEIMQWNQNDQNMFSRLARNWVIEKFSWKSIARQYGRVYHSLAR